MILEYGMPFDEETHFAGAPVVEVTPANQALPDYREEVVVAESRGFYEHTIRRPADVFRMGLLGDSRLPHWVSTSSAAPDTGYNVAARQARMRQGRDRTEYALAYRNRRVSQRDAELQSPQNRPAA